MPDEYEDEKLTIHLHSGTKMAATVTSDDLETESARIAELNARHHQGEKVWSEDIEAAEDLVESALTKPPKPRWVWIGDAFVFTQAVAGVEYGDER